MEHPWNMLGVMDQPCWMMLDDVGFDVPLLCWKVHGTSPSLDSRGFYHRNPRVFPALFAEGTPMSFSTERIGHLIDFTCFAVQVEHSHGHMLASQGSKDSAHG